MAEIKLERIDLSNTKKPPRTSVDGPASKPSRKGKSNQKRAVSVEKVSKASKSRSKSRSTSRSRTNANKRSSLGAKVLTKKEMAASDVAPVSTVAALRRSKRTSSTASTANSVDSKSKQSDNLNESTLSFNLMLTNDDETQEQGKTSRYELRKQRTNTPVESSTPSGSPNKNKKQTACSVRKWFSCSFCSRMCSSFNKCFESGYLRFTLKQFFQILIASILLVISLAIINHFELFDVNNLKALFNPTTIRNSFVNFLTNTQKNVYEFYSSLIAPWFK